MSSTQALIRTQSTSIIGAQWLATDYSHFMPQAPAVCKGHVREVVAHNPRSGQWQPGGQPRFEIQRDGDMLSMVHVRFQANAIAAVGGTFARYIDLLGLFSWTECVVRCGTQTLQTIRPIEILCYVEKMLDDEGRQNILNLMGAGNAAQRSAWALAAREYICPMMTMLGLKLFGELSQGLYVRGLNDFITLDFRLAAANEVIEADGALPAVPAAGYYQNGVIHAEMYHLTKSERKMIAGKYKLEPHSITFDDTQFSQQEVFAAGTLLPSTQNFNLNNITQPVTCLMFLFRWEDDLLRTTAVAGGSRGRNLSNVAGWWNPGGGATNEILDTIQIRSGNNDILATIPADRLVRYQHTRDFKGYSGVAIPAVSYSLDASMVNAVLGFTSFDQIERPRVTLVFRAPTLGVAHATVGAAATADIGTASGLAVDILGFTKTDIDQANFLLSRPFN